MKVLLKHNISIKSIENCLSVFTNASPAKTEEIIKTLEENNINIQLIEKCLKLIGKGKSDKIIDIIKVSFSRDDLHQIITYMYILPAKQGALIYPFPLKSNDTNIKISEKKDLYGYGGQIFTIGVPISKADKFPEFCDEMQQMEESLAEKAQDNFPK